MPDDDVLSTLATKLDALELTDAEADLLSAIIDAAGSDEESEVDGFAFRPSGLRGGRFGSQLGGFDVGRISVPVYRQEMPEEEEEPLGFQRW